MRAPTLRRCLTVLASASIALVAACGGRPTPRKIKEIISSSPKFQEPIVAYVPRRIALIPQAVGMPNGTDRVNNYNPDFFRTLKVEPYTVAKISAPLAVLWASGGVEVSDAATARTLTSAAAKPAEEYVDDEGQTRTLRRAESAHTWDAYGHVLTVRRRDDGGKDWIRDTVGPVTPPNQWYQEATMPGWIVTLAHRRFLRIDAILDETSVNEQVRSDELLVQFTYEWVPTAAGQAFVPGTDAYDELPESVKYVGQFEGGPFRSNEQRAHLVLRKTMFGWELARIGRDFRDAGGERGPM